MPDADRKSPAESDRDRRLAEALRANLRKRKAQARGRRAGEADGRAGLAAGPGEGHTGGDTQTPESGG